MKFTHGINYFYSDDILHELSKNRQTPVMYINAVGVKNCSDLEKIEEVWDFYYDKCDNQILTELRSKGEIYCYFITLQEAMEAFNDWFPQKNQLLEDEMHFYFYVRIIDVNSGVEVVNGENES